MLTNQIDGLFTISELEVWEVTGYFEGQFFKYDIDEIRRLREIKVKPLQEKTMMQEVEEKRRRDSKLMEKQSQRESIN